MNCPLQHDAGADLILDYCSHRLEADQVIAFERHLTGCEECSRVVEAQRSVWEALDHFEALPVSEDFDARLWKRIEESESRSWWRKLADGPALGWSHLLAWKPAMVTVSACTALFAVMVLTTPHAPQSQEKAMVDRSVSVDLDQVESTIDDLNMLQQLGVVDDNNAPGAM